MPVPKYISPEFFARRSKQNQWDEFARCLDDLLLDRQENIDAEYIITHVIDALYRRKTMHLSTDQAWSNLELCISSLEALKPIFALDCDKDGFIKRLSAYCDSKKNLEKIEVRE